MTVPHDPASPECRMVSDLLGRVSDRWTLRVLLALQPAPLRFNALRRRVEGVSQQMLARTLRTLERDGMVVRTVFPSVPPQVEYALTPLGRDLAGEGARLGEWAFSRLAAIEASRARFDQIGGPGR